MGTRCLTIIQSKNGTPIVAMYRQMDGYPDGHGQELADFLRNKVIVNGIGLNDGRDIANGMDDLAAQIVTHFKSESMVGGFYLFPPDTRDVGEEYIYTVYLKDEEIYMRCYSEVTEVVLFDDEPSKFDPQQAKQKEEQETNNTD